MSDIDSLERRISVKVVLEELRSAVLASVSVLSSEARIGLTVARTLSINEDKDIPLAESSSSIVTSTLLVFSITFPSEAESNLRETLKVSFDSDTESFLTSTFMTAFF